jgi:hypothetical protein
MWLCSTDGLRLELREPELPHCCGASAVEMVPFPYSAQECARRPVESGFAVGPQATCRLDGRSAVATSGGSGFRTGACRRLAR